MWRSLGKHYMVRQSAWLEGIWFEKLRPAYSTMTQAQSYERVTSRAAASPRLFELKDNKEAVYGALDAWVAWEQNFPIGPLRRALVALEKEQQWHRVIQVIKWMLSKGQGNTNGTYTQLIRALDMDHRAEEAHRFWVKKIGNDLHSVPWQLCSAMISIYYRNNMLDDLVKLFKNLEAFDRKPTDKSVVQKVADAYEMLGRPDEKHRILDKYNDLFTESPKKSRKYSSPKKGKK
ncbi:hypothetical protein CRG98_044485 [Punica granatum]|uniref:Pentatricopeptide repeat-containing protein At4g18975, chloroplastic n=1 Tax=Punica granatum TaxID=22663 RepID=A0A2I0HTU4_PUNGR|nr:hypothetical protein CRG98_044485 [Punica granatum]